MRSALTGTSGVQKVQVDLPGKQAKVEYDDKQATVKALVTAVSEAGYDATPLS